MLSFTCDFHSRLWIETILLGLPLPNTASIASKGRMLRYFRMYLRLKLFTEVVSFKKQQTAIAYLLKFENLRQINFVNAENCHYFYKINHLYLIS